MLRQQNRLPTRALNSSPIAMASNRIPTPALIVTARIAGLPRFIGVLDVICLDRVITQIDAQGCRRRKFAGDRSDDNYPLLASADSNAFDRVIPVQHALGWVQRDVVDIRIHNSLRYSAGHR